MDWTWYLFRFDGRINRAKLWLAMVVLLGLMMSVGLVIVAIHSLCGGPASFHFGAKDLFKLVESRRVSVPDIGRLPPASDQAVRHVAADVGLFRARHQAAA
jgi:hypothetical protein